MRQGAQKRFPPDAQALPSDVPGVMNNRQASDEFIFSMQRYCIDVDRRNPHPQKRIRVVIFPERFEHDGGGTAHQRLEVRRNSDRMALRIVDCESSEMFTIGELLNRVL